jgi:hypothetical protein
MNQYFNRYEYFNDNGEHKIVPGIEILIKSTDKFAKYKRGKDRLDRMSQEYYDTPLFGWLIMLANPALGSLEFEIPDNSIIRIPFPLINTLQDYKKSVELYKLYYGE